MSSESETRRAWVEMWLEIGGVRCGGAIGRQLQANLGNLGGAYASLGYSRANRRPTTLLLDVPLSIAMARSPHQLSLYGMVTH